MTTNARALEYGPALSREHHFQPVRHQLHTRTLGHKQVKPAWLDVDDEADDGRVRIAPSVTTAEGYHDMTVAAAADDALPASA